MEKKKKIGKNGIITIFIICVIIIISTTVVGTSWEFGGNTVPSGGDCLGSTNAEDLIFITNNNEKMRIIGTSETEGFIGIGTSDPQEKLTLESGSNIASEMGIPSGVSTQAVSGGSLSTDTYYYRVSASDGMGKTIGSDEVSQFVDNGQNEDAITISWNPVHGATCYYVYGRFSGAQDLFWTTSSTSYTDHGSGGQSGFVPTETDAYTYKFTSAADIESFLLGTKLGIGTSDPDTLLHILISEDEQGDELMTFDRTSESPADDDYYDIIFNHENDNDEQVALARIRLTASDVSDGTEDGALTFGVTTGGSMGNVMTIKGGCVGIGTATPLAELEIKGDTWIDTESNYAFQISNGATPYIRVDTVNHYIGLLTAVAGNNQVQIGDELLIDSTGGTDTAWGVSIGNYDLQTNDASAHTIATLSTTANSVHALTITAIGIKSDGSQVAHYVRHATYKNVGGTTLSSVGSVSTAHAVEQDSAWDVSFTTSGTDILIQVTGNDSDTVDWQVTVEENIVDV